MPCYIRCVPWQAAAGQRGAIRGRAAAGLPITAAAVARPLSKVTVPTMASGSLPIFAGLRQHASRTSLPLLLDLQMIAMGMQVRWTDLRMSLDGYPGRGVGGGMALSNWEI